MTDPPLIVLVTKPTPLVVVKVVVLPFDSVEMTVATPAVPLPMGTVVVTVELPSVAVVKEGATPSAPMVVVTGAPVLSVPVEMTTVAEPVDMVAVTVATPLWPEAATPVKVSQFSDGYFSSSPAQNCFPKAATVAASVGGQV